MGVLNYLVRFGWSFGDEEIFSREDLIAKFDFENVGKADGKFDPRSSPTWPSSTSSVLTSVGRWLRQDGETLSCEIGIADRTDQARASHTDDPRARPDAQGSRDALSYFFRDPVFDEKAKKKFLTSENAPRLIELKNVFSRSIPGTRRLSRPPSPPGSPPRIFR